MHLFHGGHSASQFGNKAQQLFSLVWIPKSESQCVVVSLVVTVYIDDKLVHFDKLIMELTKQAYRRQDCPTVLNSCKICGEL